MNKLIEDIKHDEGFRGEVYKDSLGFDTVGYGTKMPINKQEATLLLRHRLDILVHSLQKLKPVVKELPDDVQNVLYNMAYQMGVVGVSNFVKMWQALDAGDFKMAADEMMDSRWAIQTPIRANKLADIMRSADEAKKG